MRVVTEIATVPIRELHQRILEEIGSLWWTYFK